MWNNFSRGSLILALALICSKSGFAQPSYSPEHREWEVSGFAGTTLGSKHQFPTPVSGNDQASSQVGMRYTTGYLLGVRVTQNLGDYWSADLDYSFTNQRLRFTNLLPNIQSLSVDHYLHNFSYNVSFLPLPRTSRFRPYGGAGVGAALFYIPGSSKEDALRRDLPLRDSWEFVFNLAGGLKYLVMDGFAVSLDVKDGLSHVPSYGIPKSARIEDGKFQPGISPNGILQTWQISFGLAYQWNEW